MAITANSAWRCSADEFSCDACGSPSISVPASLGADSEVSCGRCGHFVATWSQFCRSVDQIVSHAAGVSASTGPYGISPS